jgi:AraC-like DNA-binding protein
MALGPAMARASILADYRRLALSLHLDPIALMRRAGIDRKLLEDPELLFKMRSMIELLELTAREANIDDFGLRLGEERGLPDLGPLSLMLREQPTVREALRTLIGFFHLHAHAVYLYLEEGARPVITIDLVVVGAKQCRQGMQLSVASLTSILRWLLGANWSPSAVCFTHSRPKSLWRYNRFFRCPVNFLDEFNGVVLHKSDLDRNLPAHSPAMKRQIEKYIRTIDISASDTYVDRVMQITTMALHRGEAKAGVIARYLGIDRRTLNRRLARAESNYSSVLNNVRKTLATQHLLASERPISDIAALAGFASLNSFGIWFRKTYGTTATQWRTRRLRNSA